MIIQLPVRVQIGEEEYQVKELGRQVKLDIADLEVIIEKLDERKEAAQGCRERGIKLVLTPRRFKGKIPIRISYPE